MLVGQPFIGKSWLALHMIHALVTDSPLLGRHVQGGPHVVAYVPTDGGAASHDSARAASLQLPKGRLFICDRLDIATWADPALAVREARGWRRRGVTCAVFDPLLNFIPGTGEVNSDAHMRPVTRALQAVADEGIAVLVVHHSPKPGPHGVGGRGALGTQHLTAWPRRMLHLERPNPNGSKVNLSVTNNNSAPERLSFHLQGQECQPLSDTEGAQDAKARGRDLVWRANLVRAVLAEASPGDLKTRAALGRLVYALGHSASADAGVKRVRNWEALGLIDRDPITGVMRPREAAA